MEAARRRRISLTGEQLDEVTASLIGIHARTYGRGPDGGKSHLCDDLLVSVLRGGRLPIEEYMLDRGREEAVREIRLAWQVEIGDAMCGAVERVTGHRVIDYHSQVLLEAAMTVELFALAPGGEEAGAP